VRHRIPHLRRTVEVCQGRGPLRLLPECFQRPRAPRDACQTCIPGTRAPTFPRTAETRHLRLFERQPPPAQQEEEEEDDESWALELLKDDSDLNVRFHKVSDQPAPSPQLEPTPADDEDLSDEFGALVKDEDEAPEDEDELDVHDDELDTSFSSRAVYSRFDELDEVLGESPATPPEPASEPEPVPETEASPELEPQEPPAAPQVQEPVAEVAKEPEPAPKRKPIRPKFEPKPVPLEQVIASLEPEPLELEWQQPGSWKKRLLWPLLVLLALLCLLVQVAWLEFNRLSRIEPYRSIYGVACQVLGCTLPELRDRSQIATSNLMVRTHPDISGALQVDVILQNNAPFEQTFPRIRLTFSNLHDETVATRVLMPEEYLGGELAGRKSMPVRQPIHVGLEIADPGPDAVSYHIDIVD
jgi:hypothetical protein